MADGKEFWLFLFGCGPFDVVANGYSKGASSVWRNYSQKINDLMSPLLYDIAHICIDLVVEMQLSWHLLGKGPRIPTSSKSYQEGNQKQ